MALFTLQGMDEAVANLSLNPDTLKGRLVSLIRSYFASEESLQTVTSIPAEGLVRELWGVDDPEQIRQKKKNLSSLKSAINKSLKDLAQKGKNPEGLIISKDNVFAISDEHKNDMLQKLGFLGGDSNQDLISSFGSLLQDLLDGSGGDKEAAAALLQQLDKARDLIASQAGLPNQSPSTFQDTENRERDTPPGKDDGAPAPPAQVEKEDISDIGISPNAKQGEANEAPAAANQAYGGEGKLETGDEQNILEQFNEHEAIGQGEKDELSGHGDEDEGLVDVPLEAAEAEEVEDGDIEEEIEEIVVDDDEAEIVELGENEAFAQGEQDELNGQGDEDEGMMDIPLQDTEAEEEDANLEEEVEEIELDEDETEIVELDEEEVIAQGEQDELNGHGDEDQGRMDIPLQDTQAEEEDGDLEEEVEEIELDEDEAEIVELDEEEVIAQGEQDELSGHGDEDQERMDIPLQDAQAEEEDGDIEEEVEEIVVDDDEAEIVELGEDEVIGQGEQGELSGQGGEGEGGMDIPLQDAEAEEEDSDIEEEVEEIVVDDDETEIVELGEDEVITQGEQGELSGPGDVDEGLVDVPLEAAEAEEVEDSDIEEEVEEIVVDDDEAEIIELGEDEVIGQGEQGELSGQGGEGEGGMDIPLQDAEAEEEDSDIEEEVEEIVVDDDETEIVELGEDEGMVDIPLEAAEAEEVEDGDIEEEIEEIIVDDDETEIVELGEDEVIGQGEQGELSGQGGEGEGGMDIPLQDAEAEEEDSDIEEEVEEIVVDDDETEIVELGEDEVIGQGEQGELSGQGGEGEGGMDIPLQDAVEEDEDIGLEEEIEEIVVDEDEAEIVELGEDEIIAQGNEGEQTGTDNKISAQPMDISHYIEPSEALADLPETLAETQDDYLNQIIERFMPKFIKIPQGHYLTGSRQPRPTERPQNKISLKAFYISQLPVTNDLYDFFVRETGYETDAEQAGFGTVVEGRIYKRNDPMTGRTIISINPGTRSRRISGANWRHPSGPGSSLENKANHPVVQVSRNDALAFAAWAGKRLPSEDEWEAAARGRDGFLFPWGNEWIDDLANLESSHIGDTTPVTRHGKNSMSPFGLLDLLGNVYEWTATLHITSRPEADTLPPISILKGGSWSSKKGITAASRILERNTWSNIIGFRCAV